MKTNEYMEQTEQYVLHTYNRFPLVIDHGEGVHLYDTDGKAYLDFAAGIAVYALGYSNDDYKKAVKDQVDKVIHVSNLFYNVPMGSAAEKLAKVSGHGTQRGDRPGLHGKPELTNHPIAQCVGGHTAGYGHHRLRATVAAQPRHQHR